MSRYTGNADDILGTIDEAGYCVLPEVIDANIAGEARLALAELEGPCPKSETVRSTRALITRHSIFRRLVSHSFIIDLWRRYLGEDMICSSCTGVTLLPGHREIAWHVDYPYWALRPPYPTWNLAGYALWMLDDFTIDNGATGIIPRSHRRAHPPKIENGEWPDDAIVATGMKGSVLLAHGAYWHTARPNTSTAARSAVVIAYLRAFCIPHSDMRRQLEKLDQPTPDERLLFCAEQFVPRS